MKQVNQIKYKEALKWIAKILKDSKIKFNVLGGLAAYAYGSKRMLIDIDLSMSFNDMKKLGGLAKKYVVEAPEKTLSNLWKGRYMELDYKGIAIEIGEAKNTKFFNIKSKKWEKFPDELSSSKNKKVLGVTIPITSKKNLIEYKSKLGRDVDIIDLKNLGLLR